MPQQSKKRNPRPRDVNARAFQIVQEATGQAPKYEPGAPDVTKNPHAVALGRMGGLVGGAARAAALSPKKRSEIAARAARARWGNPKKGKA
jgi:hypothetical protein